MEYGFDIDYRQQIINMVTEIKTDRFLKMIYGFVRVLFKEERYERQ